MPDVVPEIEEREAARYNGYTWRDWQKLEREERVDGVAYFRIRHQIEIHQADAEAREIQRKSRMRN